MGYDFKIEKATVKKEKPADQGLGFGRYFTDHMFLMNYNEEKGWHDGRIVPYGPLPLEPSAMVFHYAQELFEGLKAYRTKDGSIQLFRPQKNIERMNNTCDRLCVPRIDPDLALEAIKAGLFSGCTNLASITLYEGIKVIEYAAFSSCMKLENITIPASVTNIGGYVFEFCTYLTTVTFNGTKAQWNAITKGNKWDDFLAATHVHCIDGDVAI